MLKIMKILKKMKNVWTQLNSFHVSKCEPVPLQVTLGGNFQKYFYKSQNLIWTLWMKNNSALYFSWNILEK